jgi:hypothetical protein
MSCSPVQEMPSISSQEFANISEPTLEHLEKQVDDDNEDPKRRKRHRIGK